MSLAPTSVSEELGVPGWHVEIVERSAGVYRLTATDARGRRFEHSGTDPQALLERCRRAIEELHRESRAES